jgi:hypothetical protein
MLSRRADLREYVTVSHTAAAGTASPALHPSSHESWVFRGHGAGKKPDLLLCKQSDLLQASNPSADLALKHTPHAYDGGVQHRSKTVLAIFVCDRAEIEMPPVAVGRALLLGMRRSPDQNGHVGQGDQMRYFFASSGW